nr:probable pectate lyase 4 [Ipomoea batatas]
MGNHHGRYSDHRHHHHHNPAAFPVPAPPPPHTYKYEPPNQSAPPIQHSHTSNMALLLPYAHVDSTLRALAGQAEGFGRFAVGGLHGPLYHVTTLADDGPGSLRDGCRRKEPLWIVFEVSGTIELRSYLNVSSYKTIDGRGQRIKLTGKGLRLKECEHVIVCNLEFEGGRGPDVDGIQIKPNSKHIWIDRCSLSDYDDGLIDITRESTDITISRLVGSTSINIVI